MAFRTSQPGSLELGRIEKELQAAAELAVLGEPGVETLAVQAVGVVAVAARGDGLAFAEAPAHPAQAGGGQVLHVEPGHGPAPLVVEAAGDALVDEHSPRKFNHERRQEKSRIPLDCS